MAGSANEQDEVNPVFSLGTQVGKMGLQCTLSLGIDHFVPTKAKFFGVIFWLYNKHFIDKACLRQDICVIDQAWGQHGWILAKFFFAFLWTEMESRSIKTQKRNSLLQYFDDIINPL